MCTFVNANTKYPHTHPSCDAGEELMSYMHTCIYTHIHAYIQSKYPHTHPSSAAGEKLRDSFDVGMLPCGANLLRQGLGELFHGEITIRNKLFQDNLRQVYEYTRLWLIGREKPMYEYH
jgi:hypothetical protein